MVSSPYIPKYLQFSFSLRVLKGSWLRSSIALQSFSFYTVHYFLFKVSFIPTSWLYILIICIKVSIFLSSLCIDWFFPNTFTSSMYIRWLLFLCFVILLPSVNFLNAKLNGMDTMTYTRWWEWVLLEDASLGFYLR